MRTHMSLALAAAMTLTGAAILHAQQRTGGTRTDAGMHSDQMAMAGPTLPAGTKPVDNAKVKDMTEVIGEATERAVTRDEFDAVVARLVDMDRNRIGKFANEDHPQLNQIIAQLQQTWKQKYNQDFDIKAETVFADAKGVEGEITDATVVSQNWPASPTARSNAAMQAGMREAQPITDEIRKQGNIDEGREIGIVRLSSQGELPSIDVSFVDELGGWKIDLPNTRTGQQIHDSLVQHLTQLNQNAAQWPADVNQAHRVVAHHVIMALYGIDTPAIGDMRQ